MISSKLRLKLYDPESLHLMQDRLVEQSTEFNLGPKEKHLGPFTIELNLQTKEEVELAVNYLKKLALDLPLEVKAIKKSSSSKNLENMLSEKEPLLDLKKTVIAKATSQEELIELLRTYDFKFTNAQYLEDFNTNKPGTIELNEKHKEYQFMARLYKEAKDPINDKWDMRLVFGIKIMGERVAVVKVYMWGKFEESIKLAWKNKVAINFKKKEKFLGFPEFMDYPMRRKFRLEYKKIQENPDQEKTPFYKKWEPYVKVD